MLRHDAARGPADVTRDVASPRVQSFGTSVFTEMSRLANQHGAVNLGQGFPDFPGPSFVKEAARAAIDADLNQYAVSHGVPRLRAAIAREWNERYGMDIDPDREITVTSGATEAIFDAVQALLVQGMRSSFLSHFTIHICRARSWRARHYGR
jgi:aspartate/methionine/tyrosine aminotransferase